jgi:tetratricopeptide (TPR) repeat protein
MTRIRAGASLTWMVVLLTAWPVAAQEPEIIEAPAAATEETEAVILPEIASGAPMGAGAREVLADLWFRHRALAARGKTDEAAQQVKAALEFMKREGLRAASDIALAFLAEAKRAMDDGDYQQANERFRLASRFDPSLGAAHFGLALGLLRGDRDLSGAASEAWAGLRATFTDLASLHDALGNGLLVIYFGLCLGGSLALALLGLRHVPAFFHDLQERFPRRLTEASARLVGWWILALPVIVLLPLVWILAAWGALFATYLRRSERAVALIALLLIAAAGPSARAVDWVFGLATDPGTRVLIRSARGGYEPQQEAVLQQMMIDYPQEAVFPFLLAGLQKDGGHYDQAMSLYRRVLEINPIDARAMVNLGNLHALRQEFALAQALYRKALESDASLALAHYNSHLAHLEAFHLESAEKELHQARELNDALVSELLARGEEGRIRRVPVDIRLPGQEIWKRAALMRLGPADRKEWIRALGTPATRAGSAGLIAALILPGLGLAPRSSPARRCRRCGGAYCRRCQVATKHVDHCSQCAHLFILRDGLAPSIKSRKMEEVARHRRRTWVGARALNLALPGGGHILGGRSVLGTFLLMTWAIAWLGVLLRGRLLVAPGWIEPVVGPAPAILLSGLGLGAWVIANLSSHEPEGE